MMAAMLMPLAITLHVLSAVIWVGGMFFAYVCVRPSLPGILEPPQPARLWRAALGRFFRWIWLAVPTLLVSGLLMAGARYGAPSAWPFWLHGMFGLGIVMMLIFMHVYFAPYRRLGRALDAGDRTLAAASVAQIRRLVAVNLALGVCVVVLASGGRWF
jgi:uncharacterized membrane protein